MLIIGAFTPYLACLWGLLPYNHTRNGVTDPIISMIVGVAPLLSCYYWGNRPHYLHDNKGNALIFIHFFFIFILFFSCALFLRFFFLISFHLFFFFPHRRPLGRCYLRYFLCGLLFSRYSYDSFFLFYSRYSYDSFFLFYCRYYLRYFSFVYV